MQLVCLGSAFRAIRLELRLRQCDVAGRARLSQQTVSRLERGQIKPLSVGSLLEIAEALEADLDISLRWRGPTLPRLLDRRHAQLQNYVAGVLSALGWEVKIEESFNHYGEKGSGDALGWRPAEHALAIVEVKSEIVDLQDTVRTMRAKLRLLPGVLRERYGWDVRGVALLLVIPNAKMHRDAVRAHSALLTAALPARTRDVVRWLASPDGNLAGIWFVSITTAAGAKSLPTASRRVRVPRKAPRCPKGGAAGPKGPPQRPPSSS